MKYLLYTAFLAVAATQLLAGDVPLPSSFLRSFSLDERTPYQIPVALRRGLTTLIFPEAPQNFAAARIAFVEAGQTAPDYTKDDRIDFVMLTHRGSTSCSIRALKPEAQDTLSVFLNGKVYQLFLHADSDQPLLTVQFKFRPTTGVASSSTVSPNRLIDCLTRAKAYPILAKSYPDQLDGVTHAASNRVIDYPDFRVQISDVFRFDEADTLVFHVLLQNQSDQEIRYQRSELSIRVEPQTPDLDQPPPLYRASVVDASGLMPPRSVTSAWFAITGTRTGGRNELDPARNIFTVLIPRTNFPPSDAVASNAKKLPAHDPKDGLHR
jgi:hypothetical protein